jgi:HD-GYP domain-containing protein (c-di-GMP phosphodiesterase class II)
MQTVAALNGALQRRDETTHAHSRRVQQYAAVLASAIEPDLLDEAGARLGFLLHDIGKLGIPRRILRKPTALTPAERRVMERHPVLGERMLRGVEAVRGSGLAIVRSHHERWDGSGYPDRLAGPEIPLGARIFAVADALDAITSDRPYRRARSWTQAVAEIDGERGGQFDPEVVRAFREREPVLRALGRELRAA